MERKEAIEVIKKNWTDSSFTMLREALETLIPELKESEDEKIRKSLIDMLKNDEKCYLKEIAWLEKQGEQKLAEWSEEDEQNYETILKIICSSNKSENLVNKLLDWFKSLKGRIQPKQEWSKKDETLLNCCLGAVNTTDYFDKDNKNEMSNWLISLKDRVQPQPKQEWSGEEQQIIKDAACFILSCVNTTETKEEEERLEELADKLQDLRPQNNITDEELAQAKKDAYNNALDKIEYYSSEPTFYDGWDAAIWYMKGD